MVETIGDSDKWIPSAKELAKFLRHQREPVLLQQTLLVLFFTTNMAYVIIIQVPTASNENIIIFGVVVSILILLFIAAVIAHKRRELRVQDEEASTGTRDTSVESMQKTKRRSKKKPQRQATL